MPRIRAEQIQDLTIRDINIANDASIDQSKIEDWEADAADWISKGIIKAVPQEHFTDDGAQSFEDFWDGSQAGQLYYNTSTNELWIGTDTSPYHNLVAGHGTDATNGWDSEVVVQMGTEATDYGTPGTNLGTTFDIGADLPAGVSLANDGSNTNVYLNGALMEKGTSADYSITGDVVTFNYDIYGEDKVTVIVYSDASLTNYATKAYVDNKFFGDTAHAHTGSDSLQLNFNDAMETSTDIDGVTGNDGVLINHNLIPTTNTRDLGSASNPWGNVYADEGHFSATSVWIDNAKLQFNTQDSSLEVSTDGGANFAKVAKSAAPNEPAKLQSGNGQKVQLESSSGVEFIGDIIPDAASTRDIGSSSLPFNAVYADEVFLSGSSLYVNGKKVVQDVSDVMTFSTNPNQGITIETLDDAGTRADANISFNAANTYNVNSVSDMTFTINSTLTDKDIAFVNNSTNGGITFNGKTVFYDNIEPGTDGNLHLGSESKAFNDIFINTILFRPLAEAQDYAKIDSEVSGSSTLVKHQIGATAADSIVFQGNTGTSINDLLTISGDGTVTISGDLVVSGTTTTVESTTVNVEDSTFVIHHADTPIDGDASFEVERASGNSKLQWNDTAHRWEAVYGANAEFTRELFNADTVEGVNFYTGATDPTATTRLNMDGYFYATRVYNAVYNDLAEFMPKAEDAQPGDVVVMTESGLARSRFRGDRAVVGVVSDSFGYALGADDQDQKLPIGISGRVWVKVSGSCEIGDLLIAGENGTAVAKQSSENAEGTVIGKALERNDSGERRIMMLIMNR